MNLDISSIYLIFLIVAATVITNHSSDIAQYNEVEKIVLELEIETDSQVDIDIAKNNNSALEAHVVPLNLPIYKESMKTALLLKTTPPPEYIFPYT